MARRMASAFRSASTSTHARRILVAMAVVGGDLREPDGLHVVLGLVHAGVRDLHRVDGHAVAGDRADPSQGLLHGQA